MDYILSFLLLKILETKKVVENKIETLVEKLFEEDEMYQHCFLLEVNLHPNKKLEVFVDSDTGIKFSECQKISRYLESFIDEEGWLGEKYTLEVSSPGIGTSLKLKRQYPKNIGRKFEVVNIEGVALEGTLVQVTDEHIVLEEKVRVKEGKKKVNKVLRKEIPYDEINKAVVKISFK